MTRAIIISAVFLLALLKAAYGAEGVSVNDILQRFPVAEVESDLPPETISEHRREIARAISKATPSRWEQALLVAVAWHESRLRIDVCSGELLGDSGRAYGCWQSWAEDRSGGIDGQSERALEQLRLSLNYCRAKGRGGVRGAVSLYATGRSCDWVGAERRVRTHAWVWGELK